MKIKLILYKIWTWKIIENNDILRRKESIYTCVFFLGVLTWDLGLIIYHIEILISLNVRLNGRNVSLRDMLVRSIRPTFFPCNSEHAIDDVWRERRHPRGTTDPRPSCKTSERHPFWRLQDTRRVPLVARARNRNERNTIVEPPITPIAGRVTTPTGDSLTTHSLTHSLIRSLFTDTLAAASTAAYVFVYAREKEKKTSASHVPKLSLGCFSIRPRPGRRCFLSVAGP